MSREEMIKFLRNGDKEIGIGYENICIRKYGGFHKTPYKVLKRMVEELDWLWK